MFIYYASSDMRLHVATTTIDRLLDYVKNTAADGLQSATSVQTLNNLFDRNLSSLERRKGAENDHKKATENSFLV